MKWVFLCPENWFCIASHMEIYTLVVFIATTYIKSFWRLQLSFCFNHWFFIYIYVVKFFNFFTSYVLTEKLPLYRLKLYLLVTCEWIPITLKIYYLLSIYRTHTISKCHIFTIRILLSIWCLFSKSLKFPISSRFFIFKPKPTKF